MAKKTTTRPAKKPAGKRSAGTSSVAKTAKPAEEYVVCTIVEFFDGTADMSILHQGTLEECEQVADEIRAIANKSDQMAKAAFLAFLTVEEYKEVMREAGDLQDDQANQRGRDCDCGCPGECDRNYILKFDPDVATDG